MFEKCFQKERSRQRKQQEGSPEQKHSCYSGAARGPARLEQEEDVGGSDAGRPGPSGTSLGPSLYSYLDEKLLRSFEQSKDLIGRILTEPFCYYVERGASGRGQRAQRRRPRESRWEGMRGKRGGGGGCEEDIQGIF